MSPFVVGDKKVSRCESPSWPGQEREDSIVGGLPFGVVSRTPEVWPADGVTLHNEGGPFFSSPG